jgi:predicted dienelactone hydrolase
MSTSQTAAPFSDAAGIPVNDPSPVATVSPIVLPMPGRPVDMEIKVSVPATDSQVPVILLSHGHGPSNFLSSLHGYGPVAGFWAAHGFAVIQPTHLDSMMLALREANYADAPLYWRSRALEMSFIIDHLDEIEAAVPGLGGRLDRGRIAAVGHSLGGHTVALLCGQRATDPVEGTEVDLRDERVQAGVLMAPPGNGDSAAAFARAHYPVLATSNFATMRTRALVIAGDKDLNPMFSERIDWRADAYFSSPGPKSLLTIFGGEHGLGGVAGWDAAETTDENPERVAAVRALTWAYLRTALDPSDSAWTDAIAALESQVEPPGSIESK